MAGFQMRLLRWVQLLVFLGFIGVEDLYIFRSEYTKSSRNFHRTESGIVCSCDHLRQRRRHRHEFVLAPMAP